MKRPLPVRQRPFCMQVQENRKDLVMGIQAYLLYTWECSRDRPAAI